MTKTTRRKRKVTRRSKRSNPNMLKRIEKLLTQKASPTALKTRLKRDFLSLKKRASRRYKR